MRKLRLYKSETLNKNGAVIDSVTAKRKEGGKGWSKVMKVPRGTRRKKTAPMRHERSLRRKAEQERREQELRDLEREEAKARIKKEKEEKAA